MTEIEKNIRTRERHEETSLWFMINEHTKRVVKFVSVLWQLSMDIILVFSLWISASYSGGRYPRLSLHHLVLKKQQQTNTNLLTYTNLIGKKSFFFFFKDSEGNVDNELMNENRREKSSKYFYQHGIDGIVLVFQLVTILTALFCHYITIMILSLYITTVILLKN